MQLIKLSQDKFALVDDEDFERINKSKWCYEKFGGNEYCMRKKNGKTIRMHQEILKFPDGLIDHIDRNGLNNQKINLRITSRLINILNSKVKNYYFDKTKKKFICRLTISKQTFNIGRFDKEIDAVRKTKIFKEKIINILLTVGEHYFYRGGE